MTIKCKYSFEIESDGEFEVSITHRKYKTLTFSGNKRIIAEFDSVTNFDISSFVFDSKQNIIIRNMSTIVHNVPAKIQIRRQKINGIDLNPTRTKLLFLMRENGIRKNSDLYNSIFTEFENFVPMNIGPGTKNLLQLTVEIINKS